MNQKGIVETGQKPQLLVGGGMYDRTRPVQDGRVSHVDADVRYLKMTPAEAVKGLLGTAELHAAEVSLGALAVAVSEGRTRYRALPVFLARAFRHGSIFVRADNSVIEPSHLQGGRVGLPDLRLTTAIWVRGMLSDQYGLDLNSVTWVVGGMEVATPSQPNPLVGGDFRIETVPEGQTLWEMLAAGELDAVIAARTPTAIREKDARFKRLFTNFREEEEAYFRATQCFPPLHVLAYDTEKVSEVQARAMYEVFNQARDIALTELEETAFYFVSLPWLPDDLLRARHVMGQEFWSYGYAANRESIDTFCRYCHEQRITGRLLNADELFTPIE